MDGNSMYVTWLTLASHLRDPSDGRLLAREIDDILLQNEAYAARVKLPRPAKS